MTPDETLRALAALESAWRQDEEALAALTQRGPDEVPLPMLVAEYGDLVLQSLVTLALGPHDPTDPEEEQAAADRRQADVTARMCAVLGQTLRTWADSAPDEATGDIARAAITAIVNFTVSADDNQVLPLLAQLRAHALDTTQS